MNINLINWIAQLVHRNNGGALGVADCMAAYLWAQRIADEMYGGLFPPQHDYLVGIQERVMPNLPVGTRTNPLKIGGGKIIPAAADYHLQLTTLALQYDENIICHDEWYFRFQLLHPFLDGNGRTGAIAWRLMALRADDDYRHPPRFNDLQERFDIPPEWQ